MSNNLSRKSLAFGALVALASAALTGAPAQAAGEVVFAPSTGTSYNTLLAATYSLTASLAPGQVAGNITQLKYQIAETAAGDVTYKVRGDSGFTASTGTSAVIGGNGSATAENTLQLKLASGVVAAAATYSTTVTAFIDSNSNSVLDAGEYSQARTITFKKAADVVPVVTITAPNQGDTTVKATANWGDLNVEQLAAAATAASTDGFEVAFSGGTSGGVTATNGVYSDTVSALAASATFTAGATYGNTLYGTAATSAAAVAKSIIALATSGATLTTGADAVKTGNTNYARTNKAFTVAQLVQDTASTPAAKAGVSVTATVSASGSQSTTRYLTINGVNYTGADSTHTLSSASFALTSDAKGLASLTITPVGYAANETVTVSFAAQNFSNSIQVVEASAAYSVTTTDALASTYRKAAHAATTTVGYKVADQFSVAPTGSYRLVATLSGTGFDNVVTYNTVTAGAASIAYADPATSTGSTDTASVRLQVQGTDGNWTNVNGSADNTVTINNSSAAGAYITTPAATATGVVSTDSAYKAGGNAPVSLTVRSAVAGSSIKLAGTGLGFELNSKIYTDSVSFIDNGADVTVKVYSFTAGVQNVVTTVDGAASNTSAITYSAAAAALVSINVPANAQAGQAMDVVFTVTDVHGNAKQVATSGSDDGHLTISSTGAGYLSTTGVVATNAKGQFTAKLITGGADLGTSYINAVLDLATDVTVAKSVEFGLTDADVVAGGHRVFVDYSFAKGKTLTITIDGVRKYSQVVASDNSGELAFTQAKKGYHTVTVRISGGIVFTEKVKTN